ncbi:MAG: hypothetical protein K1V84_04935 [Muribaculaceae bacterium]
MKKLGLFFTFAFLALCGSSSYGQIGYQVSVLDQATGEPRANENVSVSIELSNSAGDVILAERKSAVTNDFGVVSIQVGSESTFADMDWNKLPLFISATVDGVLIGKSQVLTVPVAEYAKQTGGVTKDILCGRTWTGPDFVGTLTFGRGGTVHVSYWNKTYRYYLSGNMIIVKDGHDGYIWGYVPEIDAILGAGEYFYK